MVRFGLAVLSIWGMGGVILLSTGCQTRSERPEGLPFHSLYQPIASVEAEAFLAAGLELLQRDYGPLEFPVHQVLLRYSQSNSQGDDYQIAEHFSLTEIVDASAGIFAIYIAVPPEHEEFYPLLAHEIGHLKQPSHQDDWDMEGFCMVFSEKLCVAEGKDWSVWTRRFSEDSQDPYARAYRSALSK
jgi:hypothetical protein